MRKLKNTKQDIYQKTTPRQIIFKLRENKTTEKQSLEEIQRETICLTYRGMRLRTEVDFSEIMLARREESELFES